VCWLLEDTICGRLKAFKVTEYVCGVCVCVCVCESQFVTACCIVTNSDSSVQAAVLSETQTVTQFILQLLFTSVIQSQL
jgi:hypothetical protein